jgi:hypothetical protein
MRVSEPGGQLSDPPDPGSARDLDELVGCLRALKLWAGDTSYETITRRVNATWQAAGRPADELARRGTVVDCFKTGRRRINTDLVVAVVRALHDDAGYLTQWQQALRVILAESTAAAQVRVLDRLPADITFFTGRDAEVARLRRLDAGGSGAVCVLAGMAGVGKSQLAIHAGRLLAAEGRFDTTLFVNLRGFHPDPGQPPAEPAAVLDGFLRLLGVSGQQIPHGPAARAALFRERLAGRRALVVLDNAADEEQVRPLVPGGAGSLTLVTSRRRLDGLGPVHLDVAPFTPDEAEQLLVRSVPGAALGADTSAYRRVALRCGHLPLALGVVAGQMVARPGWTVTDHADRLDERHRHRRLDSGVELALHLSYQHLPGQRQALLRHIATHPGPDLDAHAAAALLDTDLDTAAAHLRGLVGEHLVQQPLTGRYVLHDLVRAYAADRAHDEDRTCTSTPPRQPWTRSTRPSGTAVPPCPRGHPPAYGWTIPGPRCSGWTRNAPLWWRSAGTPPAGTGRSTPCGWPASSTPTSTTAGTRPTRSSCTPRPSTPPAGSATASPRPPR